MSFSILFPTNEFTSSSKSAQQIQKLTLEPQLSLSETLLHISTKGLSQQYPYLYKNLPEAHQKVLGFVCSQAPNEQAENQLLISDSFKKMVQEKSNMLTPSQKEQILNTCLECLNNFQSTANEFVQVIELTIKNYHDKGKLLRQLQNQSLQLGKPNQPSISKVTAGRLITILSSYTGRGLKNELVDILKKIFIATEVEARKIAISQLFPKLLQILDLQFVQLHFQQRIFQAVWDEDEEIRVMALDVILRNASKFGQIEQSSRILKLFVDSLTSKNEKIAVLATSLMGETYQKLQHVLLKNEPHCIRFWKSLVELSQSKDEKVLNNLIYNLPGILTLASTYHRVDPICDIYIDLFYNPKSNKITLASYFHEMVRLFPSKWVELRDLLYWMLSQLLEDGTQNTEAIKITSKIILRLSKIQQILIQGNESTTSEIRSMIKIGRCFESTFSNYMIKFLDLLIRNKLSAWIVSFLGALKDVCIHFSSEFIQNSLLPKLYACLRAKTSGIETIIEIIVLLLAHEGNPITINNYFSKVSTELMKSSKSFERDIALTFFYQCTYHFSIEIIQQYRVGEKMLSFNSDKNYKIRFFFISQLPRIHYFLTKEEKIQYTIIVSRLQKDSTPQIQQMVSNLSFDQEQFLRQNIFQKSRAIRQSQKQKFTMASTRRHDSFGRRPITLKQIRKDDISRRRLESTRAKTKVMSIKDATKKRMTPLMVKTSSNINVLKNL